MLRHGPLVSFSARTIFRHLSLNFYQARHNPKKRISLDVPEVQEALCFWLTQKKSARESPLDIVFPNQTLAMDASELGWGAVLDPHQCSGLWSREESLLHVHLLETLAVVRALQAFEPILLERCLPSTDLQHYSHMAYINKMGGTRSPSLDFRAHQITL